MNLLPTNLPTKSEQPLFCRICGKPVAVETTKTDGDGKAIHEACYLKKVKRERAGNEGREG